ncbi:MAG: PKD domain-containing protein [Patescibacteria group bacterium]
MKKLIFGVVISLFAIAPVASAAGLTQQQIDAILGLLRSFGADTTVVANVESALTGKTVPAVPAAWCHTFNTNLRIGDQGGDTEALHKIFNLENIIGANPIHPDSDNFRDTFGEDTASAVVGFQEKYKSEILTPVGLAHGTGYVGPATRKKLNQLYGCGIKVVTPPIACTQEAKLCPDGSYVSRTGPKCEFAACPGQGGNQPPVIGEISGPTGLGVGETGTWTIKASDSEKGNLAYDVCWGDNSCGMLGGFGQAYDGRTRAQSATFQHAYQSVGTYTATFTVTDDSAQTVRSSITVKVGQQNSLPSIKVLSPNGGEQYIQNSSINLVWSQNYYGEYLDAMLYSPVSGNVYSIKVNGSDGKNSFLLPSNWTNILPGQYKITLCDNSKDSPTVPGKPLCDSSDASFSIVVAQ